MLQGQINLVSRLSVRRAGKTQVTIKLAHYQEGQDNRRLELSADAHFAKAKQDTAAIGGTPKIQAGPETREQQNLIELPLHRRIARAGNNSVRHNLAARIQSGLKQQRP